MHFLSGTARVPLALPVQDPVEYRFQALAEPVAHIQSILLFNRHQETTSMLDYFNPFNVHTLVLVCLLLPMSVAALRYSPVEKLGRD